MLSYSEFSNDKEYLKAIVQDYGASSTVAKMKDAKKYYDGNNTTIQAVTKEICIKQDGGYEKRQNPFVSNHKIANKFVEDMVNQKVYTLLDKSPRIIGVSESTIQAVKNVLDYAIQQMGVEASLCGVSYAYVEQLGRFTIKPFESEKCIGYFDDITEDLKALVRHWRVEKKDDYIQYIEVFEENQYTLYIQEGESDELQIVQQGGYKAKKIGNIISSEIIQENWNSGLPIIVMKNNHKMRSDFDESIKSQIDAIDIVQSDFCNNLADFQDIFWIIKGLDNVSAQEIGQFTEAIKATYKASLPEGADIETRQIEIPHEAKIAFLDTMKKQLISNSGCIDTDMTVNGGLTATAIRMASQKLMLRVSKFEYEVYNAIMRIMEFAKEYTADTSTEEVVATFIKSYIGNDTEVINNLTMSVGQISQQTYLENHPYVEDVEEEMQRLASQTSFNLDKE